MMKKNNKKTFLFYLLVLIAAFAVYYNSIENQFVFDDESVVVNNRSIQSLSNIPHFFTAEEGFHKVIGRYYRPVISMTYAIDYSLWQLNPAGFHFTNVLIHVIASLLLLALLMKLFEDYKYGRISAVFASLVFAVHPVHTEAVSWISGRTDSLVTLFFFVSFLFYLKYSDFFENNNRFLYISLLFYALGLLSKEMIITLPVIIVLFDVLYKKLGNDELKKRLPAYAAYAAVSVIYLIIRYLVLKDVTERTKYMYFDGKDGITVFLTMLKTIPVYFRLLLFPVNLLYHYNGTMPDSSSLLELRILFSFAFVIVLIISVIYLFKKWCGISYSVAFFLISLMPVMNIVPTMNFMAERFLYMTSFSLSLAIAYIFTRYSDEKLKNIFVSVLLIIVLLFSYMTFERNKDWKDDNTLYSTADGIDGSVLLVNAGNIYANNKNFNEAEKRYRRAIEIRDNSLLAHHNLGLIYLIRGNYDSAEIKFKKGLSIDSLAPDGYFQLSNIYQQQGRTDEAIQNLEKLQSIIPDYRGSAAILEMLKSGVSPIPMDTAGSTDEKIMVNNRQALLERRSFQYYQEGKFNESIKDIFELMKLNPAGISGYYNNIAMCYEGLKDDKNAEKYYLEALKSDESNVNSLNGIAGIYIRKGDRNKSIEYLKKALKLNPNDATAKNRLDSLSKLK